MTENVNIRIKHSCMNVVLVHFDDSLNVVIVVLIDYPSSAVIVVVEASFNLLLLTILLFLKLLLLMLMLLLLLLLSTLRLFCKTLTFSTLSMSRNFFERNLIKFDYKRYIAFI